MAIALRPQIYDVTSPYVYLGPLAAVADLYPVGELCGQQVPSAYRDADEIAYC